MGIAALALILYNLGIISLACHMTVNHGWYWIFLLLLTGGKVTYKQEDDDNPHNQ